MGLNCLFMRLWWVARCGLGFGAGCGHMQVGHPVLVRCLDTQRKAAKVSALARCGAWGNTERETCLGECLWQQRVFKEREEEA